MKHYSISVTAVLLVTKASQCVDDTK